MKKQHPSSLPLFVKCVSSAKELEYRYDNNSPEAKAGSAKHEVAACVVLEQPPDLPALAERYQVELDDLEIAEACTHKIWGKIRHHFGAMPRVEVELESDLFKGRADLVYHDGEIAVVLDWKFGRTEGEHLEQLGAYGHCVNAMYGMPSCGYVTAITAWPLLGVIDIRKLDDKWLHTFGNHIKELRREVGKTYSPGEHCTYCRLSLSCRARDDFLRSAGNVMTKLAADKVQPATLARLYPQAKMLENALDNYRKALRIAVEEHGALSIGDGRELALSDYNVTVVDAQKAWPILADPDGWRFTDDDMAKTIKMSSSAIQDVVAKRAERGDKAKVKTEVIANLIDGGAAYKVQRTKVAPRKVKDND